VPETERAFHTREKIVDSAARVFAERGYVGASLADIVAGSGMTRGAFYFHFTSKAELAAELIRRQHSSWDSLQRMAADDGLQGFETIKFLLDHLSRGMRDAVSARAAVRLARESDLIGDEVVSPFQDWSDCFGYNLRQAQLLGQMRADLDPVTYAGVIVGMFLGVEEYSRNPTNPLHTRIAARVLSPSDFSLDAMWEIVLRGMTTR
jgi:AcrR family transcriptional regulator